MIIRRDKDDSFEIEVNRFDLNMLQRAIQSNPFEEVQAMWQAIMTALEAR